MLKAMGCFLVGMLLLGASAQAADLTVDEVWARASAGGNGAVFMTLVNSGAADDQLVAASTPAAAAADLHMNMEMNGVMSMHKIPAINVGAGKSFELAPGGYHVMLMNLTAPLKEGDHFPLTLTFAKAGNITVQVPVNGVAAMSEPHHHTPGMDMGGMHY